MVKSQTTRKVSGGATAVSPDAVGSRRIHLSLLVSAAAVLLWSGLWPSGQFNWLMETLPAIAGGTILLCTYRRMRLTTLTYSVVWILALILMIGGHYTYAQVPIGNWFRDTFHLSRNHFDRVGHVFQGVVPALLGRELLLRTSALRRGKWLFFLCVASALAISAGYELFEWRYAVTFGGKQADDFLGSQGDIWDAQEDMAMALIGALISLPALGWLQDRQIRTAAPPTPPES